MLEDSEKEKDIGSWGVIREDFRKDDDVRLVEEGMKGLDRKTGQYSELCHRNKGDNRHGIYENIWNL